MSSYLAAVKAIGTTKNEKFEKAAEVGYAKSFYDDKKAKTDKAKTYNNLNKVNVIATAARKIDMTIPALIAAKNAT